MTNYRAAIVVNPSKFDDLPRVRAEVDAEANRLGWDGPAWFETDADDGGVKAARQAISSGADVVCAFGGDGTVRAVAAELRGGDVPMGLMPAGTGNLLARNLGVPLNDPVAAINLALTGAERRIDIGLAHTGDEEHVFLVAAGVGLDAEIMRNTDEGLKKRIGWVAYLASGAKSLVQRGFGATIRLDDRATPPQRARMVLACNCSSLQGGMEIALGAAPDDGMLDLVVIRPSGVLGWLAIGFAIITRRERRGVIGQYPAASIEVDLSRPTAAEVDGDPIGHTRTIRFDIEPAALIVRVPRG